MADNTTINAGSGGDVIASDDIGGVKYQRVKVGAGADGSYADADATHPLPVQVGDSAGQANVITGDAGQGAQVIAGARKEVTFSTTTAQAVASTDVSNYRWVSVHVTSQGGSSTVTFQGSNDGSAWVNVPMVLTTSTSTIAFSTTATGLYVGACSYRYYRLNVTGILSGTTAGVIQFFANPATIALSTVTADTELPSAATIVDALTNPSTPQIAADAMSYNGASWDRLRTPNVFKTATATASGDTALWTPTSGKKFRLMRYIIHVTGGATLAAGADLDIVLRDATTALNLGHSLYVPTAAGTALGGFSTGWINLGNGPLSAANNNVLNVNLSAALTAGKVRVTCCGTEE